MVTDLDAFLRWFDSVNRRAMRDIGVLPPEAEGWKPPAGEGESAWDVGQIVGHMAASRLYFARAYLNQGWIGELWPEDTSPRATWVPALDRSAADFREMLEETPDEWLGRRIQLIDTEGTISGWRVLMMMAEHDVHHRSQIDTYAGINGWPIEHIFGRTAESIAEQRDDQLRRHATGA